MASPGDPVLPPYSAELADSTEDSSATDSLQEETKARWWRNPTLCVVCAVLLGVAVGCLLGNSTWAGKSAWITVLGFPGKLWLKALKCVVLPMIVFSMVSAMVMLRTLPGARLVGVAVIALYSLTTFLAGIEGCIVAAVVLGQTVDEAQGSPTSTLVDLAAQQEMSFLDTVLNIFNKLVPSNLVDEAAKNNLLPVIMASTLVGLLVRAKQEDGTKAVTLKVVDELNEVVVRVVGMLMSATPLGVGSLVLVSAASLDLSTVGRNVAFFMVSVCVGLCFHMLVVYPVLLVFLARRSPLRFFYNIIPALLAAFGTASSAAALPLNISCNVHGNGLSPHISKFVLSLGATVNMDGTGIYLICATYFLGTLQGADFGIEKLILMAILATLCSMGAAPVPSASLVLLATIMTSVGVEMDLNFGLITTVDWMLDRLRTVVNAAGDATVAGIIDARYGTDAIGNKYSGNPPDVSDVPVLEVRELECNA